MEDAPIKKLMDTMLLLGSAYFFRTFLGMIRSKVVALRLDKEGIGILGPSVQLIGFLWTVGTLCIGTAIIKYLSEYLAKKDDEQVVTLLSTAFWILLVSSLVSTTFVLATAKPIAIWLFNKEAYWYLVFTVGLGIPAYIFARFFECILNGQKRIRALALSQNITTAILIISIYPLVALLDIQGAVLSVVLIYGLGWIFYLYYYRKDPISRKVRLFDIRYVKLSVLKIILRFSAFDLTRGFVVYFTLLLVPKIIIHQFGEASNGIYQAAWSLSFYLTTLFSAFIVYYLPRISELEGEDVANEIRETIEVAIITMTPLILGTLVFRNLLIPLFYDSSFAPASDLLRLFMLGKLFEVVNIILFNSFLGRAKLWSMLGFEAMRSGVYVFAVWDLLPLWGLKGGASGYLISHVLMTGLGTIYLRQTLSTTFSMKNVRLMGKALLLIAILAVMPYEVWYHYVLAVIVSLVGIACLIGWKRYEAILKLYLVKTTL